MTDLVKPFVEENVDSFDHWHYLIEDDKCRENFAEIRIRFETETEDKIKKIKDRLSTKVRGFSRDTNLTISDEVDHGSHEGEHGKRNEIYNGFESEKDFEQDWSKIKEIFQMGSEYSLKILNFYSELKSEKSLSMRQRRVIHPNFLHYPANQLLIEP